MLEITKKELKTLIQELAENPTNLELINSFAIVYFENPSLSNENEELKYFELAYKTKRTIKSAHNLAWYLYFEWGEEKRAFEIQKECIDMNPKSSYPYYQFGYMLLDQKKYEDSIYYLGKALQLEKRRDIVHNIGYCYFQLADFKKASELFSFAASSKDIENRSLFNLALSEYQCGHLEETKSIVNKMFDNIEYNVHTTISGYEVGLLFFLLKNYSKATACIFKQNIDFIDLYDWPELSFAHFQTDKGTWQIQIEKSIKEKSKWIEEIKGNHEDWNEYSAEEKRERLYNLQSEVKQRYKILESEMVEPITDFEESMWIEPCSCLLFDCRRHGNLKDD